MDKKTYLLRLCQLLGQEFPLFRCIRVLVENTAVSNETIDAITDILRESIRTTQKEVEQKKLQKAIDYAQKIKEEKEENIPSLDSMFDAIP